MRGHNAGTDGTYPNFLVPIWNPEAKLDAETYPPLSAAGSFLLFSGEWLDCLAWLSSMSPIMLRSAATLDK
jgi:hypothetical protein